MPGIQGSAGRDTSKNIEKRTDKAVRALLG